MILFDPTEAREASLLPQAVITAGRPLIGLEALTGADLMLTRQPLELTRISNDTPVPILSAFAIAVRNGMLIQRKSGLDLLSSLDKLNRIQLKMMRFGGECWLLATGVIEARGGMVVLDKRVTKWKYSTLMAKIVDWQRRGGYWYCLPDDEHLTAFVAAAEKRVTGDAVKVVATRQPAQSIVPAGWWERLTAIPGFGLTKAQALAEWLADGNYGFDTMAHALEYLSWEKRYVRDDHPNRVGPSDFKNARAWLMLEPGQRIVTTMEE